jgi:hypothetical protein
MIPVSAKFAFILESFKIGSVSCVLNNLALLALATEENIPPPL